MNNFLIRSLDIMFSFVGILLLSPLLIIVSMILKFTGENEIIYKQTRIGKNLKTFSLYKFATMLKDSSSFGSGELTQFNDPRVLPVGKFLRKTKINELPQLFNVLKGDMSIVGPRPQTRKYFNLYSENAKEHISSIKPGLSGIASIIFRNEEELLRYTEDPVKFDDECITPFKGDLEIWYVENKSLINYIIIIFMTVAVVIIPSLNTYNFFSKLPDMPDDLEILKSKIKNL